MKQILFSLTLLFSLTAQAELPGGKPFLKKHLPFAIDSIMDAGANDGSDTIELYHHFPNAIIYAFEPAPNSYAKLYEKTKNYDRIKTYPLALSDKAGTATFYLSTTNQEQSSSLLKPTLHIKWFDHVKFGNKVEVQTITLDNWAQQEEVDHIDLLWLDLQGSEYKVLNASPEMLSKTKAIFTEVNFVELYEGCVIYPIFKRWLESKGFKEVFMYPDHKTFGDSLFIRN